MENKQTAVEWLINQIEDNMGDIPMDIQEQAKQMEDEQLLKKYGEGYDEGLYDGMNK